MYGEMKLYSNGIEMLEEIVDSNFKLEEDSFKDLYWIYFVSDNCKDYFIEVKNSIIPFKEKVCKELDEEDHEDFFKDIQIANEFLNYCIIASSSLREDVEKKYAIEDIKSTFNMIWTMADFAIRNDLNHSTVEVLSTMEEKLRNIIYK